MFLQLRRIQLDTSGIPVSHVPEVASLFCHSYQLKIIAHLADVTLHSPGHQLLCVGGASGGGPLANNRITVVSSPFKLNGLNETEWVVSATQSSQLDAVLLLLNNL